MVSVLRFAHQKLRSSSVLVAFYRTLENISSINLGKHVQIGTLETAGRFVGHTFK